MTTIRKLENWELIKSATDNLTAEGRYRRGEFELELLRRLTDVDALKEHCQGLVNYRNSAGPLSFQLEKADDWLKQIELVLSRINGVNS